MKFQSAAAKALAAEASDGCHATEKELALIRAKMILATLRLSSKYSLWSLDLGLGSWVFEFCALRFVLCASHVLQHRVFGSNMSVPIKDQKRSTKLKIQSSKLIDNRYCKN
jgi:hypothetical protein